MRAEHAFFDETKTGELSSRLTADCQQVGDRVELNVNVFARSLLQVGMTTAAMLVINWRLGRRPSSPRAACSVRSWCSRTALRASPVLVRA